ncbi:MAG: TfoX/Sxy family protein [Gammaproteobacteria bacterium]|nr:TfoX/Sxy family protein [Gammaproteobacteria bacterium]
MASDLNFVEFVVEQIQNAGAIRHRKMFGEYALYCNDKVVALICDNQLFVKPTKSGRVFIGKVVEKPPYSGAKPSFLIEDQIEDSDWISRLICVTEAELPLPKPKPKKKKIKR